MAKLFEGRKQKLFYISTEGPTGRTVEEQAQDIVAAGHREIERIFQNRLNADDLEDVKSSLNYRMEQTPSGPLAVIGLRDRGEIEVYLAKNKEGRENWFENAVRAVLG